MINKLIGLFRNKPSSPEETRLEEALRYEAKRILSKEEDEEVAVAQIVSQARRKPRIQTHTPAIPWLSPARGLLGGAAVLAVILVVLKFGNSPQTKHLEPQLGQPEQPATEFDFADPMKALVDPFAPLVFNPLEPAAEEWNRFTGDTREKAVALLVVARSWTSLPSPDLPINTEILLPELPGLHQFSPYGNEFQRLRNDAIKAFEALPFLSGISG